MILFGFLAINASTKNLRLLNRLSMNLRISVTNSSVYDFKWNALVGRFFSCPRMTFKNSLKLTLSSLLKSNLKYASSMIYSSRRISALLNASLNSSLLIYESLSESSILNISFNECCDCEIFSLSIPIKWSALSFILARNLSSSETTTSFLFFFACFDYSSAFFFSSFNLSSARYVLYYAEITSTASFSSTFLNAFILREPSLKSITRNFFVKCDIELLYRYAPAINFV